MQDPHVIMTRGFKNIVVDGKATGFQVNILIPYYRGTFLSLVHYLSVRVDGEQIPREHIQIVVAGKSFSLAQMEEADEVRWEFGAPATLLIRHEGGLVPGVHAVEVGVVIRKSYFPPQDPEHLYEFFDLWKDGKYTPYIEAPSVIKKRMTIVQ
jgi:hypothetical protein